MGRRGACRPASGFTLADGAWFPALHDGHLIGMPRNALFQGGRQPLGGVTVIVWGALALLVLVFFGQAMRLRLYHSPPVGATTPTPSRSEAWDSRPVAALRDVTLQRESGGTYAVYLGLDDETGNATTADASVRIELAESKRSWSEGKHAFVESRQTLLYLQKDFSKGDFHEVALGEGPSRHISLVARVASFSTYDLFQRPQSSACVLKIAISGNHQPRLSCEVDVEL